MTDRHADLVRSLLDRVTETPGSVPAATRRAIRERAGQIVAGQDPAAAPVSLAPDLRAYVDAVIHHAYRVTDEDVARLGHAGHSDDTLFEVTVNAAVGAGTARLARALALLQGGR